MKNSTDEIKKKRLLFGIGGSMLFIFLGWYLFSTSEKQRALPGDFVEILGIVSMIFFGCALLIGLKKYFDLK